MARNGPARRGAPPPAAVRRRKASPARQLDSHGPRLECGGCHPRRPFAPRPHPISSPAQRERSSRAGRRVRLSATGRLTGGHLVGMALRRAGVDTVFTLAGDHVLPTLDVMDDMDFRFVDTRHEQGAVHMADAWGRITGGPGVAMYTTPGFANAIPGLSNAMHTESPLLSISGSAPLPELGRGAMQEIDQVGMATPTTKGAWMVSDIRRIPQMIAQALRVAYAGRRGPVHLTIPIDVQEQDRRRGRGLLPRVCGSQRAAHARRPESRRRGGCPAAGGREAADHRRNRRGVLGSGGGTPPPRRDDADSGDDRGRSAGASAGRPPEQCGLLRQRAQPRRAPLRLRRRGAAARQEAGHHHRLRHAADHRARRRVDPGGPGGG